MTRKVFPVTLLAENGAQGAVDFPWPKKGKKKSNKTITISILKPISSGLTKENFIQILEKNIYSELDLIN